MANPQPDKFTRISNEILDNIVRFAFNGTQLRIIMAIWRYTYGFNRKSAELSLSFLSTATDISERLLRKELKRLIEFRVLIVAKEQTGNKGREIGFNKNYDQWMSQNPGVVETKNQSNHKNEHCDIKEGTNQTRGSIRPEVQLMHTREVQLMHTREVQLVPQERQLKDNFKENIYIVIFDHWNKQNIVVHRKLPPKMENAIKKAVKETSKEQVMEAITRFGIMYHDKECEWCKYAWGLDTFLKREKGYKYFLDDGEKWLNYQRQKGKGKQLHQARSPDRNVATYPFFGDEDTELM